MSGWNAVHCYHKSNCKLVKPRCHLFARSIETKKEGLEKYIVTMFARDRAVFAIAN